MCGRISKLIACWVSIIILPCVVQNQKSVLLCILTCKEHHRCNPQRENLLELVVKEEFRVGKKTTPVDLLFSATTSLLCFSFLFFFFVSLSLATHTHTHIHTTQQANFFAGEKKKNKTKSALILGIDELVERTLRRKKKKKKQQLRITPPIPK